MEEPLEDELEDEPIDEDAEDEPMFEEPIEVEDSEEVPMEYDVQEGAGDPDDGDGSNDSDSDGDDGGDDGGNDDGDGGDGGDDYHVTLLAKGWSVEIHFDLHGDAYYHPKLLSLVRCYHTKCTV
jgi:hypothetical protein